MSGGFRPAVNVPNHWLPRHGLRDASTGYLCIARRADGQLEACTAPGLWAVLADQKAAERLVTE